MTINSKKALKSEINKLDDHNSHSLKADYYKQNIKKRTFEVLKRIKKLKENGKKTHIKVRMVPESNPDSKFIYYAKKPTKGRKQKTNSN